MNTALRPSIERGHVDAPGGEGQLPEVQEHLRSRSVIETGLVDVLDHPHHLPGKQPERV